MGWIPYRTKFRRTKFSTDKIFRRAKFSTPSRNFDTFVRFLPDFCIETLDKIFDGQNFSSDKIFDTKPKFRHFCPTNFCPIRYFQFPIYLKKGVEPTRLLSTSFPNFQNLVPQRKYCLGYLYWFSVLAFAIVLDFSLSIISCVLISLEIVHLKSLLQFAWAICFMLHFTILFTLVLDD